MPLEGNLVKRAWLVRYGPEALKPPFVTVLQSWDTASKAGELNDYSVCTTWGVRDRRYHLLDVFRRRMEFPDLKRAVRDLAVRFGPQIILIEDKASGTQLIQELRREGLLAVRGVQSPPGADKVMRLRPHGDFRERPRAATRSGTLARHLHRRDHRLSGCSLRRPGRLDHPGPRLPRAVARPFRRHGSDAQAVQPTITPWTGVLGMTKDRTLANRPALVEGLRARSRRRRETLARSAEADRPGRPARNDLAPRLEWVERPVEALRPPARNVRPTDPAHVRAIANSIATLGFCVPVIVDGDGQVLDGWARVEAARSCGLTHLPCVVASHLTPTERRLLRIAVNRLGETGTWDLDALRIEFGELILEDAPIEITGFSGIEIDQIVLDDEPDGREAGPLEPDPAGEPIAAPGDLFALGPHRIACGDARDPDLLARLMGTGEEARLVLTDVPYNVPIRGHVTGTAHREFAMASGEMSGAAFQAFNATWMKAADRYLVAGGVLATFIDWRGYPTVHAAAEACGLDPLNLVVWAKSNAGMGSLYRSAHELLPLYRKPGAAHVNTVELGRHGRWRSNVWTCPGASSIGSDARQGLRHHPTVKPTVLLEDALLDLTHRGGIVLDPFLGSGSTLLAAETTGRVCRGIEIDPLYVDLTIRRWEAATGSEAVRVQG